jgi:succinate-semialdehyde dehydrogenase/glutarate-semialdehyde dehydrogenase
MLPGYRGHIFSRVSSKRVQIPTDSLDAEVAPAIIGIDDPEPPVMSLVDGEHVAANRGATGLQEPATGDAVARIVYGGPEEVDAAVESAARSLALWRGTPFEERGRMLRRLASLIYERAGEIARLITSEQGKPQAEALTLEVIPSLDHLKFIIHHAEQYHSGLAVEPRHPFYAHKTAHYLYDPIGVVALVTPCPLPFSIPLIRVAAALAMGNAVVLKPSERTPLCALKIGDLCLEAGFPAGLVNVVPALPEDTLRLVAHPKVDKVFFTGSLEAGQHVMATAGCSPRPVVLSLGGKHPSVVAGDADVERAARGVVWGALANCGQNCGSIERVFVEERIASRFLERLMAEVDRVRIGDAASPEADLGPMLGEDRRLKMHRQVMEAVQGGAKLVRGGEIPAGPGFFYPPTVLLEPPLDCRLMRDETLGPVIPIKVVENLERAIMLANDSEYALSASGWTRSVECAERMMVGIQAGVVTINDALYSYGEPASTWSGYRKSGIGQNHGTPGLREMSRQRFVSFDPVPNEAPVFAYPYDDTARDMAAASAAYLHGPRRLSRLGALLRLFRIPRFRARVPVRRFLVPGKRRGG